MPKFVDIRLNLCVGVLAFITFFKMAFLPFASDLTITELALVTSAEQCNGIFSLQPWFTQFNMWISESFCNNTYNCYKLTSPLFHMATAYMVYLIGRKLYRHPDGVWSAFIYLTLPFVTASSFLLSPLPAVMFFWAVALFFFIRAIEDETHHWHNWIGCALALVLGASQHYTMLFFIPSFLLYFASHKTHRYHLAKPQCWLSMVVILTTYTTLSFTSAEPSISNQLTSFYQHLFVANTLDVEYFLHFFGHQFIFLGPLLCLVLLSIFLTLPERLHTNHAGLLLCFIAPLMLTLLACAFSAGINSQWMAPIYVPAAILVTHWLLSHRRFRWILLTSFVLHIIFLAAFLLSFIIPIFGFLYTNFPLF